MTPWLDDGDVRLYHGDALEQLRLMPSESVHCLVTSPPFWGLRDYGTGAWAGGDPDCDHIAKRLGSNRDGLAAAAARGDGYARADWQPATSRDIPYGQSCGKCGATRVDQQIGLEATLAEWLTSLVAVFTEAKRVLRHDATMWLEIGDTFVDKQLAGAPWRLAFALQEAGWFLRSDCIWARQPPNPMPESVTDRPTKSHSYVFLLSKQPRYYFDSDAIREESTGDQNPRNGNGPRERTDKVRAFDNRVTSSSRNARSVWNIATEPTPFAHFATFPQALVERCIKAGTSEHGACNKCDAPWKRVVEREFIGDGSTRQRAKGSVNRDGGAFGNASENGRNRIETIGWLPTCDHYRAARSPCVVLDPFMGSGTTALVARRLGRHATGIELNADYLRIAAGRLQQLSLFSTEADARPTTANSQES